MELAKVCQKIANMACMSDEEMEVYTYYYHKYMYIYIWILLIIIILFIELFNKRKKLATK